MKLAVFGGAGLAGSALIELAVHEGHTVRALVRESTIPSPAVAAAEIVWGDAFDADAVSRTIEGADAVVSTLGGFRGPASISGGTANIVAAMRRTGVNRLVILQGVHVAFPGDPRNPAKKLITAYLALRCRPLLTHAPALRGLLETTDDVAWTLVRIPRMVEGPSSGRAQLGRFAVGPATLVRKGDVATTLLDLAQNSAFDRDAPILVTPRTPRTPRSVSTDAAVSAMPAGQQ